MGHALDTTRKKVIELGELTQEEANKIHEFVTRDLYDFGRRLAMEEREIVDWLRLSLVLVVKDVLNRFSRLVTTAKSEILVTDAGYIQNAKPDLKSRLR